MSSIIFEGTKVLVKEVNSEKKYFIISDFNGFYLQIKSLSKKDIENKRLTDHLKFIRKTQFIGKYYYNGDLEFEKKLKKDIESFKNKYPNVKIAKQPTESDAIYSALEKVCLK